MQNILTKYCIEDNDNGLLLIDMPTGSGKTYNIIEFIFNNFDKLKRKVFFITPLKKNLTYDKLMERFKKENRLEEFEKSVLYIKSNLDTIIDNFSTVYDSMPDKIKYDKATKHIKVLIEIIKSRTSADFKTEAQNSLREDWEPEFRSIVENYVLFNIDGSKRNYEQRLNFIEEDASWINLLYPASMTDKAKVIFMTVDKFLSMNSTIVRPSYTIISDDIIKNSLIFIDEFDSAKENMLNNIIQNALNTKIALLDLYHTIYAGLTVCDFTKKLMTPSQYNINKKDKSYNFFNPDEIVDQIRENAEKIKDKYNLQFLHKLESNVKDNAYFMFQDHRYISVLPNQNSYLLLNTCKADKINKIIPSKSSTTEFELKDLLFDLKNFITFFQVGVGFIANNYRQLKLESKEDKNIISYDACVKTVLSEFGIEGKFLSYLTKNIVRKKKNKNITSSPLSDDLDFSCNEKGFRYYTILDSDVYDTQSKIQYVAIDDTPEKILLSVCCNAKVIGVSASSTLRTVTGNFDINYLEVRLGRLFKHLTKEERIYLKDKFEKQTCFYDKIELETKSILVSELNYEEIISSFDNDISQAIWELFSRIEKPYDKCRYLKLFLCMKYFIEDKNQKSFLFLTNKLLRDNDKTFDFIEAKNIFNMLTQKQNISAEICALFGDIHAMVQTRINGKSVIIEKDRMKNQSSLRSLPLLPVVKDMLLQEKAKQEENKKNFGKLYSTKYEELVCVDELGGRLKPDTISGHFKRVLTNNNLPIINFHELRHSCASLLLSMGVSMKEIQAWLGHSTYETTANIYSHLDPTAKFNTASAIVGVFGTKENIEEQEKIKQNAINKIDEERNFEKVNVTKDIENGLNKYQKEESIEEIDEEIAMLELKLAEKRKARLLKNDQDEM